MNKPELLENQTAHYFTVSSIDFEKSYKTMDMRIAKGFSDRELSFLLGYHQLYVRDVENPLHSKRYKARDTNYLLHIFNCTLPEILDGKLEELTYKLFVVVTSNEAGTKSYDIFKEGPNGKHKIFRSFAELPAFKAVGPKSVASPMKVKDFILDLLDEGYFSEPKTGLELFRTCVEHFKGHVRPFFITNAFKLIHKMEGRSIRASKNEMKRFVYSE
jgi:hypothetical protein